MFYKYILYDVLRLGCFTNALNSLKTFFFIIERNGGGAFFIPYIFDDSIPGCSADVHGFLYRTILYLGLYKVQKFLSNIQRFIFQSFIVFIYPKSRPFNAKSRKVTKNFSHIWYSVLAAFFSISQLCLPTVKWLLYVLTYPVMLKFL